MSAIAQDCGVGLDALEQANPQVANPNSIYVGQSLNMPGTRSYPCQPSATWHSAPVKPAATADKPAQAPAPAVQAATTDAVSATPTPTTTTVTTTTTTNGVTTTTTKTTTTDASTGASGTSDSASGGTPPGGSGNLLYIAKWLNGNGFSRAAAAGITSVIDGESGGNPESVGDGGWGLIGWTGNTIGLPAGVTGPTGNATVDMANQLKGVVGYINAHGGSSGLNAAGSAEAAADIYSGMEAPAVPLSDTRPSVAADLYAELGS